MTSFWQKDNDEGKLEPLTDQMVELAEQKLNVELPISYINILKQQNGGFLAFNAYPSHTPTSWARDHVLVDHLYGIGMGEEKGILESEYLIQEWDLPKKVVLISGTTETWIALDYRNRKSNPPIIFLDAEQNQEIKLAESFEEFTKGLFYHDGEEDLDDYDDETDLSEQEINEQYSKIDEVILKGTPKEIERVFTRILSTNHELVRHMTEKMRQHSKAKVHFYLLLFLSCCAEGDNKGIFDDHYLADILQEFTKSKNKDVKEFALYSLNQLKQRLSK